MDAVFTGVHRVHLVVYRQERSAVEARRRRGRPPGLVSDTTPADSPFLDPDLRAGWLLRSWRLRLEPESNARSFAATLAGLGRSADASRVSRWETGRLPVPFHVIAAYEEALGLPRGALVALALLTRKLARPRADLASVLDPRHVSAARFQEVLDVIVDGSPRGGDWLELSSFAASHPDRVILPGSVWRTLVRRLVHQLGLSVGAAYATRSEASLLLGLHPQARTALVAAVGEHVTGSESLVVADAIALLQQVDDPRAGDLVLRLLHHPQDATRNGAIWAAAAKVSRGHLDDDQMAVLERTVIGLVARGGMESGGLFGQLRDLVHVLPEESRARIHRMVPLLTGTPPRPSAPEPPGRRTVADVCRALARPDDEPDEPMLDRLVEEAMFHKVAERRFQAGLSVSLSPYRARVARGAARLLAGAPDAGVAGRLIAMLTMVATEAERDLLRPLAADPGPLQVGALVALAHVPPSTPPRHVRPDPLVSPGDADLASMRAALYCAGMTGDPVLDLVAVDPRHEEWVRRAARWWRDQGPGIHEGMTVTDPGPR